jgi:DNA-binding MarR family transcriptional regulator
MIEDLKHYLKETLGLLINPKPWKGKTLPIFLHNIYDFYTAIFLGSPCILAVMRKGELPTPTSIRKHMDQIQAKTQKRAIFVGTSVASYNRKRLVSHGVQFVITKQQIYLPNLGIDWLETCRTCQKYRAISKLTPSSQAVMIYILHQKGKSQFLPLELANALDYTPMTMSRAFNELESANLGKSIRKGKERLLNIQNGEELWQKAEPFMQSPVQKRIWIKGDIKKIKREGALAGLSALGEQTMLSLPAHPVYAISAQYWKILKETFKEVPIDEEADFELEIWHYDPKLFAKNGIADCFSLYLSLKEIQDERVEDALDKLMRSIKW